jgi:hypothetical protein
MISDPLHLEPCVIAGEVCRDDFSVVTEDGRTVGRMYRVEGARTETWAWFAHFGRSPSGRASSLD